MSDITKKITELTGIKKPEMDAIWKEVKENQAKLASCPRHDFSVAIDRLTKKPITSTCSTCLFGCRYLCSKCGGEVSSTDRRWYNLGLTHAKTP